MKFSIRHVFSSDPLATTLGFARSGCFVVELNGAAVKGFFSMQEAVEFYEALKSA